MSEALIWQIVTAVITLLTTAFSAWLAVHYKIAPLEKKTDDIKIQNEVQEKKIDEVNNHVTDVHTEINSRLSQYIEVAVKAALARGVAEGVELERRRVIDSAENIIETAKTAAKEILTTAAAAASAKEEPKEKK